MERKILKPKLRESLEIINERKTTRGSNECFFNALTSISQCAGLMHACLKQFYADESLIAEAKRNYVISLAASLETFFRDFFISSLNFDSLSLELIRSKIITPQQLKSIKELESHGASEIEAIADILKFQNITRIEENLSLLSPFREGYFNTLQEFNGFFLIPKYPMPGRMKMIDNWQVLLNEILNFRHSLVHDRNNQCTIINNSMAIYETLVLQIIQITAHLSHVKILHAYRKTNTKKMISAPAFITIDCLLRDDWELYEKPE